MKILYWVLALAMATILGTIVIARPTWLSDGNAFLSNFISHEILNVYGIFVVITLASASQLHLGLNAMEESKGKVYFHRTRQSIKQSCFWLVGMFAIAVVALLIKGVSRGNQLMEAIVNAASIWILLANVLIMWDITSTIFKIRPELRERQKPDE